MTIFQNKINLFVQDNLDEFYFDDTWCVTKSMPDGTVISNCAHTQKVLKSEGLSESMNQLESMRFRYPKLYKECVDARAKVLRTGKTESFLSKFQDVSNSYTKETDVIIVYQIWHWNERNKDVCKKYPELFKGMYGNALKKYLDLKCDLLVSHWKMLNPKCCAITPQV